VAVVTNAGGPGVIAADRLSLRGGRLAELSRTTVAKLKIALPVSASTANAVDILGDADSWRYARAVESCLNDRNVDAILVILTPHAMTDSSEAARQIISLKNEKGKTILASWIGGGDVSEGRAILENGGIPVCDFPEEAIDILMHLNAYRENIKTLKKFGKELSGDFKPKTEKNKKIIEKLLYSGRKIMTELEAKEFVANYGISAAKSGIAVSASEAGKVAGKVGFPAVMKILSPDIMHKTDVGGVKLNINSRIEAEKAFKEIMRNIKNNAPKAEIDGVFIEAMAKKRYELLFGCKKDEVFGPAIVFGFGGTAVEIFCDTAIALPPLDMSSALRLMQKTKIYKLLKGYRGQPGVDIERLQVLLCRFSRLITDFPEIKELDINPFSADENGGVVLDAKIVLE
jgi:acetyltransferase